MSERGLCSRREADRFIAGGLVRVNGEIMDTLGIRVDPASDIVLEQDAIQQTRSKVTILLNKPVGYVSGTPEDGHSPAVSLIRPSSRFREDDSPARFHRFHLRGLAPAGRLDIDSRGLLVMTQDGRVARRLIGPESGIEKEYLVRVRGNTEPEVLELLRHGLQLDGRALRPAVVVPLDGHRLRFVLTEGRKRQIRRMCGLVGLEVTGLKRVRIGRVRLGRLPPGQWRYLGPEECF